MSDYPKATGDISNKNSNESEHKPQQGSSKREFDNDRNVICEAPFEDKKKDHGLICNILLFYIAPMSTELGLSFCCIFYHFFNAFFALGLFIFQTVLLSLSLGFIFLACVGVLLLWILMEFSLLLARIDLGVVYYVVERDSAMLRARQHLLQLCVYTRNMPACCCFSSSNENPFSVVVSRAKYLLTSGNMWCIIVYQVFFKQAIVLLTGWTAIVAVYVLYMVSVPIWYGFDSKTFNKAQVCPYGAAVECYGNGSHCKCYGWEVNNLETALAVGFASLGVLPIVLRLNNYSANLGKMATYYFYTYYYTANDDRFTDTQNLLIVNKAQGHSANIGGGATDDAVPNATEEPYIEEWNQL